MAKSSVEAIPSKYSSGEEIMSQISSQLPAGMQGLTTTRNIANKIAEVFTSVEQIQRQVMYELAKGVLDNTPVKSGHLVFNWQVQVDGVNGNELFTSSPTKQKALNRIQDAIVSAKFGQKVNLFNNASYANKAENIGWGDKGSTGHHPPYKMLRKALDNFDTIFNRVITKIKKGA